MNRLKHLLWVLLCVVTTASAQDAMEIANASIKNSLTQSGVTEADLSNWLVTDQYQSKQSGVTNIYLRQRYKGIELPDANINIHIAPDGKVINFRNEFVPKLASRIKTFKESLTAEEAIKIAAAAHDLVPRSLRLVSENPGNEKIFNEAGIAIDPISAKLIYHVISKKEINLAWKVRIYTEDAQHQWYTTVDAASGNILAESDGVIHCSFGPGPGHIHCVEEVEAIAAHYESHKKQQQGEKVNAPDSYFVLPLGIESPNHGALATMVNPASPASPFGWHDTNGAAGAEYTITRGNNVYAQEDANGNNGFGYAPDGGASLDFIFPFDPTAEPADNRDAVITNLFYWNNVVHDLWYVHGFDEASGNFQADNYGNGGADDDYVIADAQDGSGTNNANFASNADGTNGRMQMYLWTAGGGISAFEALSPIPVAGVYGSTGAQFGQATYSVTGTLVDAEPFEVCTAVTNGAAINGNIAILDRGNCEFGLKCLNAQNAGAIAVVVCNNAAGAPIAMAAGADGANVTIPAVMLSQDDCVTLRTQVGVQISMSATPLPNQLDGSMDAGIVAHEYGHGISIRLTGGPASAGCLGNNEQMGEGWSDFFGLSMTVLPTQNAESSRGIGTYATGQGIGGGGIRTFPYSRNMAINPHTYDDIKTEAVPHGVGSVWCAMIWDMYWDLVDVHGYDNDLYNGTGGNNIAMKLVIEGCKLQGCSPGFVSGRDAILAADMALYNGENQCTIWNSFARRGLGFSADQGATTSATDGAEAFDLPPEFEGVSLSKTASVMEASAGDVITFTLLAENNCGVADDVSVIDDLPDGLTYVPNTATGGGIEDEGSITFPTEPSLGTGGSLTYTLDATVDNGLYYTPFTIVADDVEGGLANWSTAGSTGGNWVTNTTNTCGSTSWFAADPDVQSNQYLVFTIPGAIEGLATISFDHYYNTEADWDGGVVEISIDGGLSWDDMGDKFIQNGYNSVITVNPASGLSGRDGFSGNSGSCLTSIISVCEYIGEENVQIRFFFASDAAEGGDGWYIDQISISEEAAVINEAFIEANGIELSDGVCVKILEGELPVEMLYFEASPNNRDISLEWKTATETENAGFDILRRSEFEVDFTKIAWVDGAGTTIDETSYNFIDGNVRPNTTYYYQLKQVDYDGTTSLSEIEQARINDSDQAVVTLYPNPVKDGMLNLDIMTDQGKDITISIYNVQGKLMKEQFLIGEDLTGTHSIEVNHLAAGVYVLKVTTAGQVAYADKFIKE